jgi:chaperonin GroES
MNVKPLHDRILIKRLESEEKTKSGIIIPDNAKEKPLEAQVVAVGSGKVLNNGTVLKPSVKPGDRVLIGKYSGSEIKIGGVEHVIVNEDDIYGIIE